MSPALSRGLKKGIRTVVQLAAGGALTALVTALAGGLNPTVAGLVLGAWTALVATAQNSLESAGAIPTLLPTSGLLPAGDGGLSPAVVGTVDAVADSETGKVTGTVTDTAGSVVGEVVGQLGYSDDTPADS
jgi:hypothetical protein